MTPHQLNVSATVLSVITSFILIIAKLIAWRMTNSISIEASCLDSMMDCAASFMHLCAVRYARKPPNLKYRWGYGKIEALAGLVQSLLILASVSWLLYDVVERLFAPKTLIESYSGVVVMVFAIVLTTLLVSWQKYVIRRTRSLVVQADSMHYETDLLANIGVLISFVISVHFKFIYLDLVIGSIIAIYILFSMCGVLQASYAILMDRAIDDTIQQKIERIALQHPQVKGLDHLRTRSSGQKHFVQFCLNLDKHLTLDEAHAIAHQVIKNIEKEVKNTEVVVHTEPV